MVLKFLKTGFRKEGGFFMRLFKPFCCQKNWPTRF